MSEKDNKPMAEYVACHKQLEKRMDGSSGGVYGAFLETVAKEDYYFTGTIYDENLKVHHKVTNNPEEIAGLLGHKPMQSDCSDAIVQIKSLIEQGEKVLFCGTSKQCSELKSMVGDSGNLILIDIIVSGFSSYDTLLKYAKEIEREYGSPVEDIRFFNREFMDLHAKRITLANGRTIYTEKADSFDFNARFDKKDEVVETVSDITIGSYVMPSPDNDKLGYAYVAVNTAKGEQLFEKSKKRLVILKSGDEVDSSKIVNKPSASAKPQRINTGGIKGKLRPLISGWRYAQHNLKAYLKFIKLNYHTPSIKTCPERNGFVYVSPASAFKLVDGFSIELNGPFYIGTRRIKESRQETRLRMEKGSKIIVHDACTFGAGSNVEIYKNAVLEVGQLNSNAELTIVCGDHITIGSPCNMARNSTVRDTSGHLLATPGYKMTKPVVIGNHTWICTESTVMPGVTVGDGSIVGACSYVTKKVPPFTMVQGNPAVEAGPIKYFRM